MNRISYKIANLENEYTYLVKLNQIESIQRLIERQNCIFVSIQILTNQCKRL